jgi:hypothetical protein
MKCFKNFLCLVIFISSFPIIAWARKQYVCYYESSSAQTTELNILNMLETVCYYTLRIYDSSGKLLYSKMASLPSYQSDAYPLHELIGRGNYWGIVSIETDDDAFLIITAEYFADDVCISIDNIMEQIPPYDSQYWYWYGIYYVSLSSSDTGLIIMNPQWSTIEFVLRIYDADGNRLFSRSYNLNSRASQFFDISDLIGSGSIKWGVIDIRSSHPIAIACEYYQRGGSRLEIDNIVDYYGKSRRTY